MICIINKTTHPQDLTTPTSILMLHRSSTQDKLHPSISKALPHNILDLDNTILMLMSQDQGNSQDKGPPFHSQDLTHTPEKDNSPAQLNKLPLILKAQISVFQDLNLEIIQDKDSLPLTKLLSILRDHQ